MTAQYQIEGDFLKITVIEMSMINVPDEANKRMQSMMDSAKGMKSRIPFRLTESGLSYGPMPGRNVEGLDKALTFTRAK